MLPREDAYCPACPDPETAFRIEDVGMKFSTGGARPAGDAMTFKVTRPAWEVVMLDHLRMTDDEPHQRLYGQCVAALMAAGQSAEATARNDVQRVADLARTAIEGAARTRSGRQQ